MKLAKVAAIIVLGIVLLIIIAFVVQSTLPSGEGSTVTLNCAGSYETECSIERVGK